MDHITIPIPEGMNAAQKAELTSWLTKEAATASPERMPFEDDPDVQAEIDRGVKRGVADMAAGRVMSSADAVRRLDTRIGFDRTG